MSRLCQAALFALLLAVTGCGSTQSTAPQTVAVKGTVTLDSKPVPTGEIFFTKGGEPSNAIEIKDGAFAGQAPVGQCKVEVFVYVEGPKTPGKYGGLASKTNVAPQKYQGPNTALSAGVDASKPNEFKFDLTSK
jgi:hypothetical protein